MLIHVSNGLVRNIGCDFYFFVSCEAVSKHGITDNDDTVCQIPIVFRTDAKVIFSHQIFHNLFCGCICLIDSGIFVVFEIIGRIFSENILCLNRLYCHWWKWNMQVHCKPEAFLFCHIYFHVPHWSAASSESLKKSFPDKTFRWQPEG